MANKFESEPFLLFTQDPVEADRADDGSRENVKTLTKEGVIARDNH